jgi:hypothetical protein
MFRLLALFALIVLPAAARAEVTFLPGSRLGLDLPPGFTVATGFPGFENLQTGATFVLVERPREAWSRLRGTFTDTNLKQQGIAVQSREEVKVGDADGILMNGEQTVGPVRIKKSILILGEMTLTPLVTFQVPPEGAREYPDKLIRQTLLSLQVRPAPSLGEQVASLPFAIGDISGYHVDRTIENVAAILTADPGEVTLNPPPRFITVALKEKLPPADQADEYARQGIISLSTVSDVEVQSAGMVPIGVVSGHETVATARDQASGEKVLIVQWLLPAGDGIIRYVGVGPDSIRDKLLEDFRRLRDVVVPKG